MEERQELWCHECQKYVQFNIDVSLNGQHVIVCPNCKHEHLRIVNNGVITEARWGSRNKYIPLTMNSYTTTGLTISNASTFTTYGAKSIVNSATAQFTYGAWMNLTGATMNGYG